MKRCMIALVLLSLLGMSVVQVRAAPLSVSTATEDSVTLDFPNSITFNGHFNSDSQIQNVWLEYGTSELTCGQVIAKAEPDFTPGKDVPVKWTWDMRQSGALPPGATVWWQWVVQDANGVTRMPRQTVTWLDDQHKWKTITGGNANLHWYDGNQAWGQALHDAATSAMARMEKDTGLKAEAPVDLYIYGSTADMRDALLYEPGWTGGVAFAENNLVSIGISADQMDWGKTTIAHELTHVLVGHLTFSCLTSVPTWVNEGLAVYAEGQLDPSSKSQFDAAVTNDTLLPVRSLSGGFSEVPGRAYLSYSESYSLVKFLLDSYGRDQMNALLLQLKDGVAIDEALTTVYGFNVEGLEDAWRSAIGAKPRQTSANPTAQPSPTIIPTIIPFAGVSSADMQATQTSLGLPTATAIPPPPTPGPTPVPTTVRAGSRLLTGTAIGLTGVCCLGLLLLGGLIFLLVRRAQGGKNATP